MKKKLFVAAIMMGIVGQSECVQDEINENNVHKIRNFWVSPEPGHIRVLAEMMRRGESSDKVGKSLEKLVQKIFDGARRELSEANAFLISSLLNALELREDWKVRMLLMLQEKRREENSFAAMILHKKKCPQCECDIFRDQHSVLTVRKASYFKALFPDLSDKEAEFCTDFLCPRLDYGLELRISGNTAQAIIELIKFLVKAGKVGDWKLNLVRKLTRDVNLRYSPECVASFSQIMIECAMGKVDEAVELLQGFSSNWELDEVSLKDAVTRWRLENEEYTRSDSKGFVEWLDLGVKMRTPVKILTNEYRKRSLIDDAMKNSLENSSPDSIYVLQRLALLPGFMPDKMKFQLIRVLKVLEGDGNVNAIKLLYSYTHNGEEMPKEEVQKLRDMSITNREQIREKMLDLSQSDKEYNDWFQDDLFRLVYRYNNPHGKAYDEWL
ncbi:MAG: hypothetical protein LBJ71_04520, partial [Holosporaceae bacterium]|nr:hypothetical protein [Holosporaceae bacterium]